MDRVIYRFVCECVYENVMLTSPTNFKPIIITITIITTNMRRDPHGHAHSTSHSVIYLSLRFNRPRSFNLRDFPLLHFKK